MQRRSLLRPRSSDSETSDSLDVALTKPDDEQLFYTASVHFLRKRLEEKSHKPPKAATQSCCNLSRPAKDECKTTSLRDSHIERGYSAHIGEGTSLPMHQVLPFPKSSKDGFFTRLRNTFRKHIRPDNVVAELNKDELETKRISSFKFPRCSRLTNPHSSCLVQISEERSSEIIRLSNEKQMLFSKSNILEEDKSESTSKR